MYICSVTFCSSIWVGGNFHFTMKLKKIGLRIGLTSTKIWQKHIRKKNEKHSYIQCNNEKKEIRCSRWNYRKKKRVKWQQICVCFIYTKNVNNFNDKIGRRFYSLQAPDNISVKYLNIFKILSFLLKILETRDSFNQNNLPLTGVATVLNTLSLKEGDAWNSFFLLNTPVI